MESKRFASMIPNVRQFWGVKLGMNLMADFCWPVKMTVVKSQKVMGGIWRPTRDITMMYMCEAWPYMANYARHGQIKLGNSGLHRW